MKRTALLSAVTPLAVAAAAVLAVGDLNPPPGSVAATGKRLTDLEPRIPVSASTTPGDATAVFRITQPGSYYLTGNLTGISGANLIEIATSGVSLDLNGFTLQGLSGSGTGVRVAANCVGVEIRNGVVSGFGSGGIFFDFSGTRSALVEHVRAIGNLGGGINIPAHSIARHCIADQNTGAGIQLGANSSAFDSIATSNTTYGFFGGFGHNFVGCTASSNTAAGFSLSGNCVVRNCVATGNGDGIQAGPDTRVEYCNIYRNSLDGIRVNTSSVVIGCSSYENTGDGIQLAGRCSVLDCDSDSNGYLTGDGAGILCTGTDNRVEGNKCGGNDRGIDINANGNFLARNICSGNTTNWDIVAGNIGLFVSATTGAAFVGNSGGVAPGSTDPNANFTY